MTKAAKKRVSSSVQKGQGLQVLGEVRGRVK